MQLRIVDLAWASFKSARDDYPVVDPLHAILENNPIHLCVMRELPPEWFALLVPRLDLGSSRAMHFLYWSGCGESSPGSDA
jgi:hypothetical protein